jgi:glycosyltransferase involved in cell wall biosynthesis
VRCGVDVDVFARPAPPAQPPRRLLFAGRVEPRKGLDVAVRALAAADDFTLTVAGPLDDPGYRDRVRDLAVDLGVGSRIDWLGEVPRARVRDLLQDHDVLVFPSTGVEAYALGLLEALAAGVLVVTSAPGGPREYLEHERNALLFEPGNAAGLAASLARLRDEDGLSEHLLDGARETVQTVSLGAIVDQVEGLIDRTVPRREPA